MQIFMFLFLFFFSSPYLFDNVSPAVPFVAAWLFIFVMSTLLRTAFSDPGIVPRASAEEAAYIEKTLGEKPNCKKASHRKYMFMVLVWSGKLCGLTCSHVLFSEKYLIFCALISEIMTCLNPNIQSSLVKCTHPDFGNYDVSQPKYST